MLVLFNSVHHTYVVADSIEIKHVPAAHRMYSLPIEKSIDDGGCSKPINLYINLYSEGEAPSAAPLLLYTAILRSSLLMASSVSSKDHCAKWILTIKETISIYQ